MTQETRLALLLMGEHRALAQQRPAFGLDQKSMMSGVTYLRAMSEPRSLRAGRFVADPPHLVSNGEVFYPAVLLLRRVEAILCQVMQVFRLRVSMFEIPCT